MCSCVGKDRWNLQIHDVSSSSFWLFTGAHFFEQCSLSKDFFEKFIVFFFSFFFNADTKALSTRAGMPVGHYQLFRFSFASEAVLPDNRIVLAPRFRSCLPLPFPPCVLEWVMGTVFAHRARSIVWTGLKAL